MRKGLSIVSTCHCDFCACVHSLKMQLKAASLEGVHIIKNKQNPQSDVLPCHAVWRLLSFSAFPRVREQACLCANLRNLLFVRAEGAQHISQGQSHFLFCFVMFLRKEGTIV